MFQPKIDEMGTRPTSDPESFLDYLERTGQTSAGKTAPNISIDDFGKLHSTLKAAHCMVFRLGAAVDGKGTAFALAKTQMGWADYFLFDEDLFVDSSPRQFVPEVGSDRLFAFQLLPSLSETALVNLAFASGLIASALNLDVRDYSPAPTTGAFRPSFEFSAFPGAPTWTHARGQVEIDSAFLGKRDGIQHLFVLEAKTGSTQSLAKHKLMYPVVGLSSEVPDYIPIVPVYVRTTRKAGQTLYHIAECSMPDPRTANNVP